MYAVRRRHLDTCVLRTPLEHCDPHGTIIGLGHGDVPVKHLKDAAFRGRTSNGDQADVSHDSSSDTTGA